MPNQVNLSQYTNAWYKPGSKLKCGVWYFINVIILKSSWLPFSGFRVGLLRVFGAKIGANVVIKPGVSIKYPWKLTVGDNTWIGEQVWIDNLDTITIGSDVCISQGAMLLSGNHDYTSVTFDLILAPIHLESGVWIGANCLVCNGAVIGSHAVLTAGSVASSDLEPFSIYRGNPAVKIKNRLLAHDS
tara:strand:+ start:29047 stop:29607 length:561 start_codon:yes stop_codon:yes gene_type:complete